MKKKVEDKDEAEKNEPIPETFEVRDDPLVPVVVKTKRVERSVKKAKSKAEKYQKFKLDIDFWLRHEMQLGTLQIRKLWTKLDKIVLE